VTAHVRSHRVCSIPSRQTLADTALDTLEALDGDRRARLTIEIGFSGHGIGRLPVPLVVDPSPARRCPQTFKAHPATGDHEGIALRRFPQHTRFYCTLCGVRAQAIIGPCMRNRPQMAPDAVPYPRPPGSPDCRPPGAWGHWGVVSPVGWGHLEVSFARRMGPPFRQ